jgi:predicted membrane protein
MGFLFTGLFWGIVLVIIGLCVIVNMVFHINVPIIRILFAFLLIYFGVKVLTHGTFGRQDKTNVVFDEGRINNASGSDEVNVIFGKSTIAMTDPALVSDKEKKSKEINTVFGASTLYLGKDLPIKVHVSSAFGSARMPDGNIVSFGEYTYTTPAYKEGKPFLKLKANVVFGGMEIELK